MVNIGSSMAIRQEHLGRSEEELAALREELEDARRNSGAFHRVGTEASDEVELTSMPAATRTPSPRARRRRPTLKELTPSDARLPTEKEVWPEDHTQSGVVNLRGYALAREIDELQPEMDAFIEQTRRHRAAQELAVQEEAGYILMSEAVEYDEDEEGTPGEYHAQDMPHYGLVPKPPKN